ncbi:permease prefix domain 1-containing protein [Streptomyces anulatus]|uniref:permease prefix domain 1-containing protein n=1 Tax=Streptomyces anulatus TaxID=1892 RepID=UPI001C5ECB70|nr:permease prefix domain 1-containing protein [Streptomyces anulatus]QYA95587.1 permease prefix domain 1-containing protein [Streptomyces anulatus]
MTAGPARGSGAGDLVEKHVAELDALLHGPSRAKSRLVEEARDGLTETVAAYTGEGEPYERAVHRAVAEFGSARELAASFQRELTIAQARHTARAIALSAPFLLACWLLVQSTGAPQTSAVPHAARLLATHLATVAGAAVLLAAAALAATGVLARRLPVPHRLPLTVAWTGTTASVSMAVATLALATASVLAENWPLTAAACALAATSHAVVAGSARACRRCARLPPGAPVTL